MFRISDLRHKDVINAADGRKLGFVYDIELDMNSGVVEALVLPGESRFLGLFIRSEEIVLPWDQIKKIGVDVIIIGDERFAPVVADSENAVLDKNSSYNWETWDI
ncbi:MAG: YlmC/YmxH family sporulation protein [Clostridia bacterium]|nr:YlmC/YmxH family sporulation protein [Clostridia bacterium]